MGSSEDANASVLHKTSLHDAYNRIFETVSNLQCAI